MSLPQVVSREEWLLARQELLRSEKQHTRDRDALNSQRRRLPMIEINKDYAFEGLAGQLRLIHLFEDRHHFMWLYDRDVACPSCSAFVVHGLSVFLRDRDRVFHTYSAYARGVDNLARNRNEKLRRRPLGFSACPFARGAISFRGPTSRSVCNFAGPTERSGGDADGPTALRGGRSLERARIGRPARRRALGPSRGRAG
jgi:hypothetical protein